MTTHIALLRGINVSGKNIIKMAELMEIFEIEGYLNSKTYLQSGNIVFQASKESTPKDIADTIHQKIFHKTGLNIPVQVLSISDLNSIIDDQPFSQDSEKDTAFFHVTFLSGQYDPSKLSALVQKLADGEAVVCKKSVIYLYCPNGYGQTKIHNTFIEKQLQVTATTRNWKTCLALLALANNMN